ncbi:CRTAC1 family protein [Colwellia sp. MSW7]|uniref:CRTAC1 family protein n=1 Tax=Colwellia maritima TaxID=2912588 RepID=A0ABS9X162_9GAMM|nr:CRTAC1 family protein [Colwellia maritima]MCI2283914.1 CRTAC1 family protein [Colwellia maritima]
MAGISKMGARGRSVRWVDLDNDGDLDFLQINAEKMVNEAAPRNILFENNGDSTFTYRKNSTFEDIDAERVLITDINNDNFADMIAFNTYAEASVWLGNNDFTFKNVTEDYFPKASDNYTGVVSVAQADIDNDGDLDYYFARGKLLYTIANNSLSFNKEEGRLDIRDEGNKSHDGITLHAKSDIDLSGFYHFPRARRLKSMPVFIGATKTEIDTPVSTVKITQKQALGFPEKIDKTGWYLGYTGNGTWRLEWMLTDNVAWDVRASIKGLTHYTPDWTPQNRNIQDVLLRNDGNKFTDISSVLPPETNHNNWGVTPGDFNNDGFNDFFVYRFGELKERIADVMLLNNGDGTFTTQVMINATTEIGQNSHGDMGTAFDYNLDGKIDLLSGDDDNGLWHLYENNTPMDDNHFLLTRIGYSTTGIDPLGAKVTIVTDSGLQTKLIGSTSASHSQSVLNIAHFGLANDNLVKSVNVRWRDGSEITLNNVLSDHISNIGNINPKK